MRRANNVKHVRAPRRRAKVDALNAGTGRAVDEHEVLRAHVAVQHVHRVKVLDGCDDSVECSRRRRLGAQRRAAVVSDAVKQVAARAELCDKVHAVPVLVRLDELDKVWMASQRHVLLDLDLLLDNRQRRQRVHAALCYRLARVWQAGALVSHAPYHAAAAAVQLLFEDVVFVDVVEIAARQERRRRPHDSRVGSPGHAVHARAAAHGG
mmetsp:Transcript_1102/g.3030  ORF Transcript_1102/g.3030 Transcript_1102/m.3030 type:complete len:209 (-) Transcript_1102:593-1219(-)